MNTIQYLAAVKEKLNIDSDYRLSKALGLPSSLIAKYQAGKNIPGPLTCFKIAEILGEQPAGVIAELELERAQKAEKSEDADEWKGWVKRLGGAAASVLLAAGIGGISNAGADLAQAKNSTGIYIV